MSSRTQCPQCGDLLVQPTGPIKSDILLVGDLPDWWDVIKGKAFSVGYFKFGKYVQRAGDILRDLLTANSIRPERCRMTNVWLHAAKKDTECNIDYHIEQVYKEMAKAKTILLMGTLSVRLLLQEAGAREWSGLEILSPDLPRGSQAMGSVKMATGFKHLGEAQLAIKRFSEMVHEVSLDTT